MKRGITTALVLAVLLGIGAALWAVMGPSSDTLDAPDPVDDVVAADEQPGERETARRGGRRRSATAVSGALVGRVTRGKDRAPAEGVVVQVALGDGAPALTATSDERGAFTFENVVAGTPCDLIVSEDGSATVRLPSLVLQDGERRDVGDLHLAPAVPVDVVVRSYADVTLEGALVEVFPVASRTATDWRKRMREVALEPVSVASARTDEGGRAHFAELPEGMYTFRASHPDHARGTTSRRVRSDRPAKDVVLHLGPGFTLAGRVVDGEGAAAAGVDLLAGSRSGLWTTDGRAQVARATSDDEGEFAFDGMSSGVTTIWIVTPKGSPVRGLLVEVPRVSRVVVVVERTGPVLGRVVVAETSEPVAGVKLTAMVSSVGYGTSVEAVTDDDGRFDFGRLPVGSLTGLAIEDSKWVVAAGAYGAQRPLVAGDGLELEVEVEPGAVLTGTVTGPDGSVPGARVSLQLMLPTGGFQQRNAVADDEGRYRVEGLAPGRVLAQVTADGLHQPEYPENWWQVLQQGSENRWATELSAAAETTLDIELAARGDVGGRVLTPTGEPAKGAFVQGGGVHAVCDDDGRFDLPRSVPGKALRLSARADGYGPGTHTVKEGDEGDVEISLTAERLVRGVVRSQGELRNAYVQQRAAPSGGDGRSMHVGSPSQGRSPWESLKRYPVKPDGSFEVRGGLPDRVLLRAVADGWAPADSKVVTLSDTAPEGYVEIVLDEGVALAGRVTSEGAVLAGATVSLAPTQANVPAHIVQWQASQNPAPIVAVTDLQGSYSVPQLAAGRYRITVSAPGHVDKAKTVKLERSANEDFDLDPALEISGRVEYEDGSPVVGARVSAGSAGTQNFYAPGLQHHTGSDGSFTVSPLKPGAYTLAVDPPWQGNVSVKPVRMEGVSAGTTDLVVQATRGMSISGVVVNQDGEPVTNIQFNVQPPPDENTRHVQWRSARTDGDGKFEIGGLGPGDHLLHFRAGAGYSARQVPGIAAGTTDVRVELGAALSISGWVMNADGSPAAGIQLQAQSSSTASTPTQIWGRGGSANKTGNDGAFTLSGLSPGNYRIVRTDGGGILLDADDVAAGSEGLRLTLDRGAAISGRVVTPDGAKVSAMNIWAMPKSGGRQNIRPTQVDPDGAFTLEGLDPALTYTVSTHGGGYKQASVEASPGGTELLIELEAGLRLSGRLLDADGDPLPQGANVWAHGPGGNAQAQVGEDGEFELSGLGEGEFTIQGWAMSEGGHKQYQFGKATAGDSNVELRAKAQ